jgi:hypothetical protein
MGMPQTASPKSAANEDETPKAHPSASSETQITKRRDSRRALIFHC